MGARGQRLRDGRKAHRLASAGQGVRGGRQGLRRVEQGPERGLEGLVPGEAPAVGPLLVRPGRRVGAELARCGAAREATLRQRHMGAGETAGLADHEDVGLDVRPVSSRSTSSRPPRSRWAQPRSRESSLAEAKPLPTTTASTATRRSPSGVA